jgi:hypothetical protein
MSEHGVELTTAIKAEIIAAHDSGEWMNWAAGEAMCHDGNSYMAELVSGEVKVVYAEVYGEGEVSLSDGSDYLDDDTVSRIRLI